MRLHTVLLSTTKRGMKQKLNGKRLEKGPYTYTCTASTKKVTYTALVDRVLGVRGDGGWERRCLLYKLANMTERLHPVSILPFLPPRVPFDVKQCTKQPENKSTLFHIYTFPYSRMLKAL